MKDRKIILAEIGILFVAMFWGMGFVSAKLVLADMDPYNLLAYRYSIAFIIMLLIAVKHVKKLNKKTLKAGVLIGTIMFAGNMIQTIALQYTTPGKQTFIICMYTVIVPLLSWIFFREKIAKKMLIATSIAFIGIGFLTLQEDLTISFGDGLTFIFAITFSIHVILLSRFMKDMDPMAFAVIQIGVCAFFSIISAIFLGSDKGLSDLSTSGIVGMLQLIFLNTILAFILQNACQKIAPPTHTAILLSTETVFGTYFSIKFAGESFTNKMIIGIILVFIALIVSNLPTKQKPIKHKIENTDS